MNSIIISRKVLDTHKILSLRNSILILDGLTVTWEHYSLNEVEILARNLLCNSSKTLSIFKEIVCHKTPSMQDMTRKTLVASVMG